VIFADEAQFPRNGIQNFHNKNLWADGNSNFILPSYHQQRFSMNIWASVCSDNLFGPHTLANRITGQNYKDLSENKMPDFLAEMPLIIH
jgi:hypothetical protein